MTDQTESMKSLNISKEDVEDGPSKSQIKKLEKERLKEAKKLEIKQRLEQEKLARENAPDYSEGRYGLLPMNQSAVKINIKRTEISRIDSSLENQTITLRGCH
jgi:aspartyl-tRNA synthetase